MLIIIKDAQVHSIRYSPTKSIRATWRIVSQAIDRCIIDVIGNCWANVLQGDDAIVRVPSTV